MQLSTEVTLPKNYTPKFPAKCIVCRGVPDTTIKIAHQSQNSMLTFFIPVLWFSGWSRVEIPICKVCKPRYRLQRWGREFVSTLVIVAAFLLIAPHFKGWSLLARNVVVGLLVLG